MIPLAPFELMMHYDHRRDYPMVFTLQAEYSGPLDRDRLQRSLRKAIGRQPLLHSTIQVRGGRPCWVPATTPPQPFAEGWIDLSLRPGVQVRVHELEGGFALDWDFHHACCDGIAAVGVLTDWLRLYNQPDLDLPALTPDLLAERIRFGRKGKLPMSWHPRDVVRWAGVAWRWLRPWAQPLAPGNGTRERGSHLVVRKLPIPVPAGYSLHDRIQSGFFRALRSWNQRRRGTEPARRLRVTVPVNQRQPEDRSLPACNKISYTFVDRTQAQCGEPQALLDSIQRERKRMQADNLSRQLLGVLYIGALYPPLIEWNLRMPMCRSTAVASHLVGSLRPALTDPGPVRLECMYGTPPIRPGTALALGSGVGRQRLHLALRGDSSVLSPSETEEILDELCGCLQS